MSMSKESKNEFSCSCTDLAEKLAASVKDNERLEKLIKDCRDENERLRKARNQLAACTGSQSGTTGDDDGYKEKFEALVKINHNWKKDYEKLQMLYETLDGEKRRAEDEEKNLRVRIRELEKQQTLLEDEIARLVAASYAQQVRKSDESLSEEQREILKSQMIAYREDFERERADRENLREDKEKFKRQLEDAEDIIKELTAELEALEEAGRERRHLWMDVADLIIDAL